MVLALINQILDEVLAQQEGEFDPDTRWAVTWLQAFGMDEGPFGSPEKLSKDKSVSVVEVQQARMLTARSGKVRLIPREGVREDWDPTKDIRLTVWEITQHPVRPLSLSGDQQAGRLLKPTGGRAEAARDRTARPRPVNSGRAI
jgi:putative DNA methylase